MRVFLTPLLFAIAFSTWAQPGIPPAYRLTAADYGIPVFLLYAIARQEAGRPGYPHPWPWTANIQGQAHYFASREALYRALDDRLRAGMTHFDVGLMQISWRYNARLFHDDLWAATDPYQNLAAGARHLRTLRDRYGSYDTAVGIYHAGPPRSLARRQRAARYRESVRLKLATLTEGPTS